MSHVTLNRRLMSVNTIVCGLHAGIQITAGRMQSIPVQADIEMAGLSYKRAKRRRIRRYEQLDKSPGFIQPPAFFSRTVDDDKVS